MRLAKKWVRHPDNSYFTHGDHFWMVHVTPASASSFLLSFLLLFTIDPYVYFRCLTQPRVECGERSIMFSTEIDWNFKKSLEYLLEGEDFHGLHQDIEGRMDGLFITHTLGFMTRGLLSTRTHTCVCMCTCVCTVEGVAEGGRGRGEREIEIAGDWTQGCHPELQPLTFLFFSFETRWP